MWIFKEFVEPDRKGVISKWYDGLQPRGQAHVDVRFDYLKQAERNEWNASHYFKKLKDLPGLFEIRCKPQNIATRPIGYFSAVKKSFVIVLIVTKKGTDYKPSAWKSIAQRRKVKSEKNSKSLRVYKW